MNITRHISLEDEYVEKLKPYVEKNGGNFGAAIRDMINRADNHWKDILICALRNLNGMPVCHDNDMFPDLANFQTALQNIDSRIHRESEWKFDGKDLLYTVRKCNLASEENEFNTYICHMARG